MLTSVERAVRSLKCTKQSRINILCFFFFTGKRPNAKSQCRTQIIGLINQYTQYILHQPCWLLLASTTQIYYSFTWFFSSTNHNGSNYIFFRTAQCFCINFHSDALMNQNVLYKLCCYKILNHFGPNTLPFCICLTKSLDERFEEIQTRYFEKHLKNQTS